MCYVLNIATIPLRAKSCLRDLYDDEFDARRRGHAWQCTLLPVSAIAPPVMGGDLYSNLGLVVSQAGGRSGSVSGARLGTFALDEKSCGSGACRGGSRQVPGVRWLHGAGPRPHAASSGGDLLARAWKR